MREGSVREGSVREGSVREERVRGGKSERREECEGVGHVAGLAMGEVFPIASPVYSRVFTNHNDIG